MNEVVYVPPVYEEIQHEPTVVSSDGTVLQASLHSDVSLLMRIQSLKCDANTLSILYLSACRKNLQTERDS